MAAVPVYPPLALLAGAQASSLSAQHGVFSGAHRVLGSLLHVETQR